MRKALFAFVTIGLLLAAQSPVLAKELFCILHAGGTPSQTIGIFPLTQATKMQCRHAAESAQKNGVNANFRIACYQGSVAATNVSEMNKDNTAVVTGCK